MNVPFMDCSYGVKTVAQPLVMVTDKEVVLTARTRHGGRLTSLPDYGSQNLKTTLLALDGAIDLNCRNSSATRSVEDRVEASIIPFCPLSSSAWLTVILKR